MLHGIALGGGALIALAATLFGLLILKSESDVVDPAGRRTWVSGLASISSVFVWLTVIGGTYIVFPPYRATPPEGVAELAAYPRSMLLANSDTAWLHGIAMEMKEHVPWIAAMLTTAAAFITSRYRAAVFRESLERRLALTLLGLTGGSLNAAGVLSQVFHLTNYYIVRHGWWEGMAPGTWVYWSLAVEEHFYLFFPLFYLWLCR